MTPSRDRNWRPVVGYEASYEVSSDGQVRSFKTLKPLAGSVDRCGYRRVCLYTKETGPINKGVSRLVCEAFHGPPNPLHTEVAHLDGSRQNNRADNLKWVSHAENISHKVLHGTDQTGERHPRAKLTEADVAVIRSRYATSKQVAEDFNISRHAVFDIWQGKSWKHESAISSKLTPQDGDGYVE